MLAKLNTICGIDSPTHDSGDPECLDRTDSGEIDEDEEADQTEPFADIDESKAQETVEHKRRRRRMAILKRKVKLKGYEFTNGSDVAGVLFLEIQRITDLPPERNGMYISLVHRTGDMLTSFIVTRTSFDMDPFVVTSLGRKTFRTRVVRHNLNPEYDEKLVFQVLRHETGYSVNFTVVDRDQFSGNDNVGDVNLPLDDVISAAPEADPETGLYNLPDPHEPAIDPVARKPRFRLPLSRSSSSPNLHKLANKPGLTREWSCKSSLTPPLSQEELVPPPTSTPYGASVTSMESLDFPALFPPSMVTITTADSNDDPLLKSFELPLVLKNKERWEGKHKPMLYVRAKYLPYRALRQQFWKAMLKQYDADESGRIDRVELTTMLDNLGSTLHGSTINSFFERFEKECPDDVPSLTFDQAVICLEDQLQQKHSNSRPAMTKHLSRTSTYDNGDTSATASGTETPLTFELSHTTSLPLPLDGREREEGLHLGENDLVDESGEERVIEVRECPICHQPRLHKHTDADIITHIATCASQDWRKVNNIVMAGFVTSSQAQRKWYSKVITKISYGGYRLGANSANILVQDRMTGLISEERMSVYVRLGIRLLYKGLRANNMEKRRIKKLLRSMSIKQGNKYDDPASAAHIKPFVNFHNLDMSEVQLPTESFKNFNEFFYRALKPGVRPCSAPHRPEIVTSPADCRTVVFDRIGEAQKIWVKGREFSVERLLSPVYADEAKRYVGGSLGIFRLAPQDYHRFHIPVDGVLGEPKSIEGEYYTVNPMAIRSALDVYGDNVRVVVPIDSVRHGRVMVVCVGAMMVGSTVITRKSGEHVKRAEELGYFKFGGSTILLLFEPGKMMWDEDLVDNSKGALETLVSLLCLPRGEHALLTLQIRVGMSVGHSPNHAPHTRDMKKSNPTAEEKAEARRRISGTWAPSSMFTSDISVGLE